MTNFPPGEPSPSLVPTPTSDWKKTSALEGTVLVLPSKKIARVRVPGMEAFIEAGLVPNSLLAIVQEALRKGKPPDPQALQGMADDPDSWRVIFDLCNSIAMYCFIEPRIHPVPLDPETGEKSPHLKDAQKLYVDEVDLADKFFVFQFAVGGTRDLEQFRKELDAAMESVPTSEGMGNSTLPAPKHP